jgi:hypothetical protein
MKLFKKIIRNKKIGKCRVQRITNCNLTIFLRRKNTESRSNQMEIIETVYLYWFSLTFSFLGIKSSL